MFPAPLSRAPRGRPRLIATIARWGAARVTLLMLLLGLVLRIRGAYSDITQLYFRDALWRHPLPYVDYPLEYPVLVGGVVWLAGSFRHVVPYFCVTAALLIGAGLLTVRLGAQFAGANLWVFALAPALPLYVVLNWDMLGVALTVATLLALRRDRDGLAGLLLALAVWTKFFPLVILPLAVWDRLLRRRPRDAGRLVGVFSLVGVAVNAPVALVHGPDGWALRAGWLHFFRFNRDRPLELNAWNLLARWGPTTAQINAASALLLVLGLVVLALLFAVVRRRDGARAGDLLLPATLAALGWWFFVNKVYSPQYSLWLIALLALAGVPARLGAAFAGIDVGYYVASFIALRLGLRGLPATEWWHDRVLLPAMVLREAAILVIVFWGVRRLYDGAANGGDPARRGHTAVEAALPVYRGSAPTGLDSAVRTPGYWGRRSREGVHDGAGAPARPAGLPGRGGRTGPDERARYAAATAGTPPRRSVMGFALRPPARRPIARVGALLPLLLFTTLLHADAPGRGTGGALGRCGEDQRRWHPPVVADCPTGHEHGDPPPTWLAASGDTVDFLGPFNTSPAENGAKHAAMKGFAARLHGVDLYVRLHAASNVLDRAARYHSYEVWARDPAGGIAHWQGWADAGDPVADRVPQRLPHPKYRPLVRVVDRASYELGYRCETWYFVTAPWSWDLRWTICGATTLYDPGEEATPEPAAWRPAPDRTLGTDRRLEATWVATPLLADGTRHTPPVGRFYATQFGELVAGPDDPRCAARTVRQGVAYPTVCLPQQLAPTMIEVAAPGNTAEHDYRAPGLTLPN